MARLPADKPAALKDAFTEDAITPGQAAQAAGVTYATAGVMKSDEAWKAGCCRAWRNP